MQIVSPDYKPTTKPKAKAVKSNAQTLPQFQGRYSTMAKSLTGRSWYYPRVDAGDLFVKNMKSAINANKKREDSNDARAVIITTKTYGACFGAEWLSNEEIMFRGKELASGGNEADLRRLQGMHQEQVREAGIERAGNRIAQVLSMLGEAHEVDPQDPQDFAIRYGKKKRAWRVNDKYTFYLIED